jgi:YVTN family beta-propeller protein
MRLRHLAIVLTSALLLSLTLNAQNTPPREKLYIAHEGSDDLAIVDVATNKVIKSLVVGKSPHGVATPKSQALLYVTTMDDGGLTVVDTIRDEVVKKYSFMGLRPQEHDITPDGRFLYVPAYNGMHQVFDTKKEEVIARIFTKGLGHNTVMSPDGRHVYLFPLVATPSHAKRSAEGGWGLPTTVPREITIVDTSTQAVVGEIPIGEYKGLRPAVSSPDGKRLYVQTNDLLGFLVVDTASRKVVSKATYNLTPDEQAVVSRSHGITIANGGKEVWSNDVNHNLVFIFDVTVDPPKQIGRIAVGASPYWATTTQDGKTVYVSSPPDDVVVAYDVATRTEKARLHFPGKAPKRVFTLTPPRSSTSESR